MKKSLLVLAISAAFVSSAGAAQQSVDAGNYIFTYDDSFWGTVFGQSGNTFTFSDLGYSASASGQRRGVIESYYSDVTDKAVTISIQAKSGYQIQSIISGAIGGITTTMGSPIGASAYAEANTYSYWSVSESGFFSSSSIYSLNDGSLKEGANGAYNVAASADFGGVQRADLTFYGTDGWVSATALGSSASLTHDASYFTVQVSAVPEPSTYAMLLSGLGIIGALGRRRARLL